MSRKISNYFQIKPKLSGNIKTEDTKLNASYNSRDENDEHSNNQKEVQGFAVKLKVNGTKIHQEITSNHKDDLKITQNIKYEQEQDLSFELPQTDNYSISKNNPNKIKHTNEKPSKYSEKLNFEKSKKSLKSHKTDCCCICGKKYFQNSSLILHMKTKHPDGQFIKYECDFDGKLFKTKSEIYHHMFTHRSRVKCQICGVKLQIGSVLFHMKNMHSEQPEEKCQICQKSFKNVVCLRKHLKTHDKKFQCQICNMKLSVFPRLRAHIRDVHENPRSYSCEICSKKFNRPENLKAHLKSHDKNRPKPFKCQRCDFATNKKANLNRHQKSHENKDKIVATMKNPLKCQKCPALLRNKDTLRSHMKYVHIEALYQCDLCGKSAKIKNNILSHIKMHIKNRLKCP